MAFQPGDAKPENSGRKPGTKNKASAQLKEILELNGVDPAVQLAQLLPELEPAKRVDVLLRILEFIYPRRKAVESEQTVQVGMSSVMRFALDERVDQIKESISLEERIRRIKEGATEAS